MCGLLGEPAAGVQCWICVHVCVHVIVEANLSDISKSCHVISIQGGLIVIKEQGILSPQCVCVCPH